jgi:hypothetical protein
MEGGPHLVLVQINPAPAGAPAGSVAVTLSMGDARHEMVIPEAGVPVLVNRLTRAIAAFMARRDQLEQEARPIPEAMLVECEPRVGDTCTICLEEVKEEQGEQASSSPWVSLSRCGHRFHPGCIRQWQRPLCPVCRAAY